MADTEISNMPGLTLVEIDDLFVAVDISASLNKKVTRANLRSSLGLPIWYPVPSTSFSGPPATPSRITMSDTSLMAVGLPLRYVIGGTSYYGVITAVSSNSYVELIGAPLTSTVSALYVGSATAVVQERFFIGGAYGDGVADLLAADEKTAYRWERGPARLVGLAVQHNTDDTGANQPKVNVKVAGTAVSTANGGDGIQVATSWAGNSAVAIDTAAYAIARGDAVEIACTVEGSNGDASDLTVSVTWVME